jgi:hypothetical protein
MYVLPTTKKRCRSRLLRQLSPNRYYCRIHYILEKQQYELGPQHVYDAEEQVEEEQVVAEESTGPTCKYIFVKGQRKHTMCGVSLKGYPETATMCKKHTKPVVDDQKI